jgi:hypothetical protein
MKYAFEEKRARNLELAPGDIVFVGEGYDDCALLEHLTADWQTKPVLLTQRHERGFTLYDQFRAIVQLAAKERASAIGLLFDAESDRKKTRDKLKKMFKRAQLEFPPKANTIRVSHANGLRIKTAYHINPANKTAGALEALFTPQVRQGAISECVEDLLKCYNKNNPLKPTMRDKVRVRTYLAYHNPSNTGLKNALDRGFLSCDGVEFSSVKRFVDLLKPTPTELLNGLAENDA